MAVYDISDELLLANTNQQTTYNPADVPKNIEASKGRGRVFDGAAAPDAHKPVIVVGGGSAKDFENVVAAHGGIDAVHVAVVGSAINRLNKDKQIAGGHPFIEQAHSVYINGVDDDKQGAYYQELAEALKGHPHVPIYIASTNGKEAFDALEALPNSLVRVNALNPHHTYKPEDGLVVGLGSTAPTAAAIIKMKEGHRRFEFLGVDGAPVVKVDPVDAGPFNEAAQKLAEPARYPEYDIGNPAWNKIAPGNKLLVHAGADMKAEIPSGQWYTMQELKTLANGDAHVKPSFKFHGGDTVATRIFEKGQDVVLINDPRGSAQLTSGSMKAIPVGLTVKGIVPAAGLAAQTLDLNG